MKKLYGLEYYYKNILKNTKTYITNSLLQKEESYSSFQREKKDGTRTIHGVSKTSGLYQLQNNLNRNFFLRIPLSSPAVGFVKGKSYQDYLRPHCGKRFHLRLDIRGFFDSISEEQVEESLEEFVQDEDIKKNIVEICMLDGCLPQGAVTSPALSNIVFRRIDQRILKYCQSIRKVKYDGKTEEEDIVYTRYADDLFFSSDSFDFCTRLEFYKMVRHILLENGFHLNHKKTYMTEGDISLSGFVVGSDVHLSRKRLREINQILNYFDKRAQIDQKKYEVDIKKLQAPNVLKELNQLVNTGIAVKFDNKKAFINYLCGYRAFLITFLKGDCKESSQIKALKKKVKNLEQIIDQCQKTWFGIV